MDSKKNLGHREFFKKTIQTTTRNNAFVSTSERFKIFFLDMNAFYRAKRSAIIGTVPSY